MVATLKKRKKYIHHRMYITVISEEILKRNTCDFNFQDFVMNKLAVFGTTTASTCYYFDHNKIVCWNTLTNAPENEFLEILIGNLKTEILVIQIQGKGWVIWQKA